MYMQNCTAQKADRHELRIVVVFNVYNNTIQYEICKVLRSYIGCKFGALGGSEACYNVRNSVRFK